LVQPLFHNMKQKKLDTLLILRGLLAVSVVVWHINESNQNIPAIINIPGRTAVWFFFGISGYVIAYGFLTKRYFLNATDIKAFYINRFLRIYPLFLLLSLLTVFTEYMLTGNWLIEFKDVPAQLFMLQFNHEYILNGVFWTLGIEVQFYLIAPLLAVLLLKLSRNVYLISIGIYLVMLAWVPFAFYFFGWSFDGRNLPGQLSHFFIGMIGCRVVTDNKQPKINRYVLAGIILVIILFTNYLYQYQIKFYWTLGTVLIDIAILAAIFLHTQLKHKTVLSNHLFLRALILLGMISYGIYAWHPYLIKYISWLNKSITLSVITSVFVAFLSYKLMEQPILQLKRHHKTGAVK